MASLLTATDLSKSYATQTLFTDVSLTIFDHDRIGLIGPNGAGKSTLLKILAGIEEPDQGQIIRRRNLKLAYVKQMDHFGEAATVLLAVVDAIKADRHHDSHSLDPETQAAIELSKLGFDNLDQSIDTLSGGWKKRLSIACALACEPEVLMLDEPTNHLDMEGIFWLEQFVKQARIAMVFITHDRVFLENAAKRVIELHNAYPNGTFEVNGNYSQFIRRKEEFLVAQANQQTALASKVRRDNAWLEQGVKGRQTRNTSQVTAATQRRQELAELKARNAAPTKTTTMAFQATARKTRKLISTHSLCKTMGGKKLFSGLDLTLSPGMCLGLLGPNGSGKTTLMRLLAGTLEPDRGTVKRAADLRIVNFTQHREELDPQQTLKEALCPIGDTIFYHDKTLHVTGWARKFLFEAEQFRTPVSQLSGGEQARIMIANLMLKPADILILDEPTNDLDIPSLQVLEQSLKAFPGAIVLVTHDRFLLSRLATDMLALDGAGNATFHASLEQWQKYTVEAAQHKRPEKQKAAAQKKARAAQAKHSDKATRTRGKKMAPVSEGGTGGAGGTGGTGSVSNGGSKGGIGVTSGGGGGGGRKKLSYKFQHELDHMEKAILEAEHRLAILQEQMNDPATMRDHVHFGEVCAACAKAQEAVDQLYARWEELEAMRQG